MEKKEGVCDEGKMKAGGQRKMELRGGEGAKTRMRKIEEDEILKGRNGIEKGGWRREVKR